MAGKGGIEHSRCRSADSIQLLLAEGLGVVLGPVPGHPCTVDGYYRGPVCRSKDAPGLADRHDSPMRWAAASANRIATMLSDHAVVGADTDGIIRIWTEGAEALFGHLAKEAVGQSLDLIIPPDYRGRHWSAFFRSVESGVNHYERMVFADPIVHADGSIVHHRGRIALMKDAEGRTIGAISTWGPPRADDQGRTGPAVVAEDPA